MNKQQEWIDKNPIIWMAINWVLDSIKFFMKVLIYIKIIEIMGWW